MDDFSRLDASRHMLAWLADDPDATLRKYFEEWVDRCVPGARVERCEVTGGPDWLTRARRLADDPDKAILFGTGVAFEFQLRIAEPEDGPAEVRGVFSWVAMNLDRPAHFQQRIWFDVEGTLAQFGSEGELQQRIYELSPAEDPTNE